jgi:short-subunit dehydrogenase
MNTKIKNWSDKKIWLVGASTGIGQALAHELLKKGSYVYLSGRNITELTSTHLKFPLKSQVLALVVLDIDQIQKAIDSIDEIDLVIYMAADYAPLSALNYDLKKADRIIDVNLKGASHIASLVLPKLLAQKHGHISFVASIAGFVGLPASSIYGATKAALINLGESFYLDLRPLGIDVSIVNPGFVKTRLTDKNEFDMPFIMTPEKAAECIVKGYEQGKFAITFPFFFSLFFRTMRILPHNLQLKLMQKMVKV